MKELKALLKKVTTSKNYTIENSCGYRLYYTGKNIPCRCVAQGKEQIAYLNNYNEMKHLLIILAQFRKLTTICTKDYIDRMAYLFGQCISHLAYGYGFERSRYIGEICLPYDLKKLVYDHLKRQVANISYGGSDSEGNDYNSLRLVEA